MKIIDARRTVEGALAVIVTLVLASWIGPLPAVLLVLALYYFYKCINPKHVSTQEEAGSSLASEPVNERLGDRCSIDSLSEPIPNHTNTNTLWYIVIVLILIVFGLFWFRLDEADTNAEAWRRSSLEFSNRAVTAEAQYNQLLLEKTRDLTPNIVVAPPAINVNDGSFERFQQRQLDQQYLWEVQRANDIQEAPAQ